MIEQAVILAGGRGTRLKPLTDKVPKPMIQFHGKPFLEYLIDNLREQGIHRILLLLGYLPKVIQNYFGDGSKFGTEIDYSITDEANDTGKRLKLAVPKIEEYFLMMYCDNYWPLRLQDMWDQYKQHKTDAQLTIYLNKDNYTRNNVKVDDDGHIILYDKSRTADGLRGVDIGYAIFKKNVLDLLPNENVLFESTVYPLLVEKKQLSAYVTDHRYYSVGSHERLQITEEFFKRVPTIILDRDGVLNKKPKKAEYVTKWSEFEWLPGAKESLALLKKNGYRIIVITNQAGIARGMLTEDDLNDIHNKMKQQVESAGETIDAIYYCPHGWDDDCECRKPKPGMLFQAQKDFNLDLKKTYFIGDDERDVQAGQTAGCKTILLSESRSLTSIVKEIVDCK